MGPERNGLLYANENVKRVSEIIPMDIYWSVGKIWRPFQIDPVRKITYDGETTSFARDKIYFISAYM